jgi:hypothetical protein
MQCIAIKHFITNAHKTHTFANIVRNLITSRSRRSLEMFLINVDNDFLKKIRKSAEEFMELSEQYWKILQI